METRKRALAQIDELMTVLHQRKETYRRRRPAVVNLIAAAEMERFLRNGLVGRHDLPEKLRRERRALARAEAEHFTALMENEPIGVQIGIVLDTLAAHELSDFPSARPADFGAEPVSLGRGAEHPRRHGHDHVGARGAWRCTKRWRGSFGQARSKVPPPCVSCGR